MPEYLAPGVYVEETSYRSKSIEGVSTTTTGFIGPTRYGPIDLEPDIITSLGEYERVYGDGQPLHFISSDNPQETTEVTNYMWHAVRAFFAEGGKRLYVVRCHRWPEEPPEDGGEPVPNTDAGRAFAELGMIVPAGGGDGGGDGGDGGEGGDGGGPGAAGPGAVVGAGVTLAIRARFPGRQGNAPVALTVRYGPDIFPTFASLHEGDIVWLSPGTQVTADGDNGETASLTVAFPLYRAAWDEQASRWTFVSPQGVIATVADTQDTDREARVVTLAVTVSGALANGGTQVWDGLSLAAGHIGPGGIPDGVTDLFAASPRSQALARSLPLVIDVAGANAVLGGLDVATMLATNLPASNPISRPAEPVFSDEANTVRVVLDEGNDGLRPGVAEYEGAAPDDSTIKTGLKAFEDVEDISIVAAPGASDPWDDTAQAIQGLLLEHARSMRYRIAVLDSGPGMTIADVRRQRGRIDSTYGALYYPWVRVMDPITREPLHLPPSGFVAGIYARNDIERAVYKAPANEVVNLAIGFEHLLNKSQQDVLNPEGINCFRFFEGRGYRLWGARTISSDPEWKYVNLRRYFAYLERSIDKGTQWVVFEPNGERLWANVRRTVEDFLFNEWQNGALLGDKPERAYFVKCDRSTMTQNDLDNGRLVCQIGVAALRPAEFVIFRIGQWTGDRRA